MTENISVVKVVLASDKNYFPGLFVTTLSIAINAISNPEIKFYILDGGLEDSQIQFLDKCLSRIKRKTEIRFIPINQDLFSQFPDFYFSSKMTYARILIPQLIPEDKIIYIDVDILTLKDIGILWHFDMHDKTALVVMDKQFPKLHMDCPKWQELGLDPDSPYFNCGLLVLDLVKCRTKDVTGKTLRYLESEGNNCRFWDQSALNVILYRDIGFLEKFWNYQLYCSVPIEDYLANLNNLDINFHFVTKAKPWINFSTKPEHLLFHQLLAHFDFHLDNHSNRNQNNISYWLDEFRPIYFYTRSIIKRLLYNANGSINDYKIYQYWRNKIDESKGLVQYRSVVNSIFDKWSKRIEESVI